MIYSLAVYGAPYSSQASDSAYHFAQAVLERGHELHRVFFYHDGVYNGTNLAVPPQDEVNIPARWSQFAKEKNVELVVCIASAIRRGLLDNTEAKRYDKNTANLDDNFVISGLGQLIEAGLSSDRLITFGP